MAHPAHSTADQVISRTTSEGRTEVDANELLRSDQVRRTYAAFKKIEELTRGAAALSDLAKLRDITAHLAGLAQPDKVREQLTNIEALLKERRNAVSAGRDQHLHEAIEALRDTSKQQR